LFILLFPQLLLGADIRIMPLGDSITKGSSSGVVSEHEQVSYRKALWDLLVDRGYQINIVGSQVAGDEISNFDPNHEGHGGWVADGPDPSVSISDNVYNFLTAKPADIVLLHIGTNDITAGHALASDVAGILNEIDRYSQNVWVVLARIVNRQGHDCPDSSPTTTFNNSVEDMASARVNDKIVMVDMECGAGLDYRLQPAGDMYDVIHPFASGYEKMADEWLEGLLEILPVAKAGNDQDVDAGEAVTLDGRGSTDRLGTIVSYAWVKTAGSPEVTLTGADTAQARFTAPDTATGTSLTFRLTITDDKGFAHSDSCVVDVNALPIPDAGPDQFVNPGASVVLDGSNSDDADGGIVSYQWVQTAGLPLAALANAGTAQASFTAPAVGSGGAALTFTLTVTDDKGAARSDSCIVTVNGPPAADAGPDQLVNPGAAVVLDGSNSKDADGSIVAYAWVQAGAGPAVVLTNADTSRAGFTAPAAGSSGAILTLRLTVTDDRGVQSGDTVEIRINGPPAADAGSDRQVSSGASVTLDGSGSSDGEDGTLAYAWVQTAGPAVALAGASSPSPSFQAPSAGSAAVTLDFALTVTDSGGLQSSDSCRVTVTPPGQSSSSGGGGGGGCFITAAGQ
jgi:lysophospholipase L1-like esterase